VTNETNSHAEIMDSARSISDSCVQYQRNVLEEHNIIILQRIGQGGQGHVFRGLRQGYPMLGSTTTPVAIKAVRKEPLGSSAIDRQKIKVNVFREIEILKAIQHANCLEFFEAIEDENYWYIITEYLNGVDAFAQSAMRVLSEQEVLKVVLQVLQGLEYLHGIGVAHRDVKLENIMYTHKCKTPEATLSPNVKLIDFGLAYYEKTDQQDWMTNDVVGTVEYRPPELVMKTYYDPRKVDIWGVGVMMYALLCNTYPFEEQTEQQILRRIVNTKESYSQPEWKMISRETTSLVQLLLCKDPARRIDATQARRAVEMILRRRGEPTNHADVVLMQSKKGRAMLVEQRPASKNSGILGKIVDAIRP